LQQRDLASKLTDEFGRRLGRDAHSPRELGSSPAGLGPSTTRAGNPGPSQDRAGIGMFPVLDHGAPSPRPEKGDELGWSSSEFRGRGPVSWTGPIHRHFRGRGASRDLPGKDRQNELRHAADMAARKEVASVTRAEKKRTAWNPCAAIVGELDGSQPSIIKGQKAERGGASGSNPKFSPRHSTSLAGRAAAPAIGVVRAGEKEKESICTFWTRSRCAQSPVAPQRSPRVDSA
jgi:hypothetical protein